MSKYSFSVYSVFLVLSPLASNYRLLGSFSYGDFFVFILVIAALFNNRYTKLVYLIGFFSIFIIFIFILPSYLISYPAGALPLARTSFYLAAFFILLENCKDRSEKIFGVYLFFSFTFSAFLLFQLALYKFFNILLIFSLPGVEIEGNALLALDLATQGFRSGGMFREPSYYSIFMGPALLFLALRRHYFFWMYSAISVILSTSVVGFVFVLLSILYFFRFKFVYIFILFLVSLLFFIFDFNLFLPQRVVETLYGQGSLYVRIIKPFMETFIASKTVLLPNFELLKSLTHDFTGQWYNSLAYATIVFGAYFIIPVGFVLYIIGSRYFLYPLVLLVVTNSLSTPYFLCFAILLTLAGQRGVGCHFISGVRGICYNRKDFR